MLILFCSLISQTALLFILYIGEAPVEDGMDGEDIPDYPLPEDHWINASLGREAGFRTLLHVAIEEGTLDTGNHMQLLYIYF
jgi:hypothetical protein